MTAERMVADTALLDIHQVVQSNIPTKDNLNKVFTICEIRSRGSGKIVRPGEILAANLTAAGRNLGQVMGLGKSETNILTMSFAQNLVSKTAERTGTLEKQNPGIGEEFDIEGLSPDQQSRVMLWSKLLKKGGRDLAKLFIEPNLPLAETHLTLAEYAELIQLARPQFVQYSTKAHFEIHIALPKPEGGFKPDPIPEPITKRGLNLVYTAVQKAVRRINRDYTRWITERSQEEKPEDLESVETAGLIIRFERSIAVVNPALQKLSRAMGLNSFESFTFEHFFKFQLIRLQSTDFMAMVLSAEQKPVDEELKSFNQSLLPAEMAINSILDEVALRVLLEDPSIDEGKMQAYISSLKNSAKVLAKTFYAKRFNLGATQILTDQTAEEIRNLRVRHQRLDKVGKTI